MRDGTALLILACELEMGWVLLVCGLLMELAIDLLILACELVMDWGLLACGLLMDLLLSKCW